MPVSYTHLDVYKRQMPSRRTPSGEYKDIAPPINSDTREHLHAAILEKFEKMPEEEMESAEEDV